LAGAKTAKQAVFVFCGSIVRLGKERFYWTNGQFSDKVDGYVSVLRDVCASESILSNPRGQTIAKLRLPQDVREVPHHFTQA
jgi:hypothetical protein